MKLRPTLKDPKDTQFAFNRLFGAAPSFPDSYIVESHTFPDQNRDNRANACTGYTVANVAATEDLVEYSPDYNYYKTLEIMGVADGEADVRTAFKVATTFGLLPRSAVPSIIPSLSEEGAADPSNWPPTVDPVALTHKKGAYTPLYQVGDWFDGVRNALLIGQPKNKTVGIATQWSSSFEAVMSNGILPDNPSGLYWGHMYQCVGWKQLNGQPYLILKTWQGSTKYDRGYCYMSRTLCNKLMGTWGAYAATLVDMDETTLSQVKQQQVDLSIIIIALCQNVIIKLRYLLWG